MVFQYQYQYQYGLQSQEGFIYLSFLDLLSTIPPMVVYLSLLLAVLPLTYNFWGGGFQWIVRRLHELISLYTQWVNRGRLKNRIDLEYQRISRVRKVRGKMEIAGLLFLGVLGYLLVTHKLFFALVLTDSMLMTLAPADLVLMESISKEISVGDIALFTAPNGMDIVHRVYSIDAVGRIRTKGDNSFEPDDWILRREDIKGKVVSIDGKPVVIKNLGWYIYPTRAYIPGSDPIYELVRDTITFVHEYGVMLVVVLVLFGILISFETKKELFYYTE